MSTFKSWSKLFVLVLLVFAFTGCGGGGGGTSTTPTSDTPTQDTITWDTDPNPTTPVQPEPTPEPVTPEPTPEPEPIPEPIQPEPVSSDPVQPEPTQPEPVTPEPTSEDNNIPIDTNDYALTRLLGLWMGNVNYGEKMGLGVANGVNGSVELHLSSGFISFSDIQQNSINITMNTVWNIDDDDFWNSDIGQYIAPSISLYYNERILPQKVAENTWLCTLSNWTSFTIELSPSNDKTATIKETGKFTSYEYDYEYSLSYPLEKKN